MHQERRHLPTEPELFAALDDFIELQLKRPEWIEENDLARLASLLTLECVGGPQMPAGDERVDRFQAVRDLLGEIAPRFRDLSQSELLNRDGKPLRYPETEPKGRARYGREVKRLCLAARTLFLLVRLDEREVGRKELRSACNMIWGKQAHPKSRWFERAREDFILDKLAEWIRECEDAYRKLNPPQALGGDAGSPPPITEAPNVVEERASSEPADSDTEEKAEQDESGDEGLSDLDDEAVRLLPPTVAPGQRLRISRLAGFVFAAVLSAAALAAAVVVLGGGDEAPANAAGEVGRVLNVPAPEDLAVAGGFVWLVNANSETAIRVSVATGEKETIFVDQPPYVAELAPRSKTGIRLGGYQVAAGPDRAWIVTNGGVVLAIGTTERKAELLNPRIKVFAGKPAIYHGSLWIGGLGSHPVLRLRASDGTVEREYAPRTNNPFPGIDALATGVGSIWALDNVDESRAYKLTPVPGRPRVEEDVFPLDRPADDLAAGLGGIWTVNSDGTVTRYDPATGSVSRTIPISGKAENLALGRDAVWVTTGSNAVVRIDPITLAVIGRPIALPGYPLAVGADENVWVATPKKLVEIES